LTTESRRLVVARAKGQARVEPDRDVALRKMRAVAFPHGYPVQPPAAPGLEVRLVAVAPVRVRQHADLRLVAAFGQQWLQQLPGRTRARLVAKDADDPGLSYDDILQQAPTIVAHLEQHVVHRFGRLKRHPGLHLEK